MLRNGVRGLQVLMIAAAIRASVWAQVTVPTNAIEGDWVGTLTVGAARLRVILHIAVKEGGALKATVESPDQSGSESTPVVASIVLTGSKLTFAVDSIESLRGAYQGQVNADASAIVGTWSAAQAVPVTFVRYTNAAQLERRRPQNPVKPYPYREEEVEYENTAAGLKLAGTLTIPPGKGPFRAVLLITGSGPQDRDESLMGHKPFLVLADYLTRQGIVVLRADDRGIGNSGGVFSAATTADFATDAEAGVALLRRRAEVDAQKIGLVGHSEGGIIAPMVAARNPDVAFIVMLAGSGVPGDDILVSQTLLLSEAAGMSHTDAEKNAAAEREILNIPKRVKDEKLLVKELRQALAGKIPEAQVSSQIAQLTSHWFRFFLEYDPAPALRKVTCPVLALIGSKDLQVPPGQNLPAIRKALEAGGNKRAEVDELPGLNHLFQTAKTGAVSEYAEIQETMSPVVLEKIASWVRKQ